jgi:ABC-type antimicrobial peptide transport system permease subunit
MRLDDGQPAPRPVDIVGVVGDVKHFGLERETTIEAYVPIPQVPDQTTIWLANNLYWIVKTDGEPLASANAVRKEIAAVDPTVAASFVRSMDQWMAASVAPRRFNLLLVEAFAVVALLLAMVGVYGMSASDVAARTREIGIRSALGGTHWELMALVVRAAITPVALGLAVGLAAAIVAERALAGLLFGVTPHDPVALVGVVVTLGGAALVAAVVPARRAAGVDPLVALRSE